MAKDTMRIYRGKGIEKLIPSGYYQVYSDAQERFLKFDDLDDAKALVDSEAPRPTKKNIKHVSTEHDPEILAGIPRGVWADLWATEQEEKGRSFSGQEITSLAPKTPAFAKTWAREVADKIVKLNGGKSLNDLYEMVTDRELDRPFPHDKDQFGLLLGMQAVGHGVSWSDDVRGLHHDAIKLPHTEFCR